MQPEEFLKWIYTVEEILDFMEVPNDENSVSGYNISQEELKMHVHSVKTHWERKSPCFGVAPVEATLYTCYYRYPRLKKGMKKVIKKAPVLSR